jgi:carbamoyltransferase
MGDGGLNLGAALQFSSKVCTNISNVSLGNKYSCDEIKLVLHNSGLKFHKSNNPAQDMAKLILERKIVAFFSGRMEYGPRALGNRSILFLPDDVKTNLWLNERLGRTDFMPFAPVTRDIDSYKYFEIDEYKDIDYRFMTVTVNVTPHTKKVAPAIVHIDGTARPQILKRPNHSVYYDTLTYLDNLSGEGILVNTSFNMHEEPIVNTPSEAIRCFKKGSLDVLVIEDFIVFND